MFPLTSHGWVIFTSCYSTVEEQTRENLNTAILFLAVKTQHTGWELFLLKQMQITKCPEFTIQQFWEKGNRGVVSSGYIESHLPFSQRGEPSHLRLNSLNRDFRGSYGVCVVNKEKGSRQFSSPMIWIDLWERLFSSAEKSWFELFFHWY